jgi:uncharacterized CHY-type Zn-finger protein
MSGRPQVKGVNVDAQTRCAHWHSPRDVVAIRVKCCGVYYACNDCHDELAGHAIEAWPRSDKNTLAVLCGVCGAELTIRQYLHCDDRCPNCAAEFNPGCRTHHHFYFAS